jgi:hypothetical protein
MIVTVRFSHTDEEGLECESRVEVYVRVDPPTRDSDVSFSDVNPLRLGCAICRGHRFTDADIETLSQRATDEAAERYRDARRY